MTFDVLSVLIYMLAAYGVVALLVTVLAVWTIIRDVRVACRRVDDDRQD